MKPLLLKREVKADICKLKSYKTPGIDRIAKVLSATVVVGVTKIYKIGT